MVDIRPNQLPDAIIPLRDTDELIVDQGAGGVRKATPSEAVNSVAPVVSQADAVAGADNVKRMTSLRTKQSIASEVGVSLASNTQGAKADSAVQTVNGKSGNSVNLVKGDVGLGNVDNTSDANKPISTATQNALNLKANDSVVVKSVNGVLPVSGDVSVTAEEVRLQDTRTTAIAESFANNVLFVRTAGYSTVGDGGEALYRRVSSEPSHAGKFQSTDGAWWEIAETVLNPMQFGAVGDGVANDGQACVDSLTVGRDVTITAGKTFLIDGFTLAPVSGQSIRGPGQLTKTATADGKGNGSYTNPFIAIDGVDDVCIDRVAFHMPIGARRLAIITHNCNRVSIRDCLSLGNETFLSIWKLSNGVVVEGNFVSGGQYGVATGGYYDPSTGGGSADDGLVTGVRIVNNTITGCTSEAIDVNWDTVRCLISNNTLIGNNTDSGEEEIDIGGGACANIIVTNNIIRGASARSSIGITLKLNTPGVIISGNSITNLDADNINGAGIRIYYSSMNCIVSGNHINGATRGIQVYGGSSYARIEGNIVDNIQRSGISVGGDGESILGVTVIGNLVRNAGSDATQGDGVRQAIAINDCRHGKVSDNTVYLAGSIGIAINSSCLDCAVNDNNVYSTGGRGIDVLAPSTSVNGNIVDAAGTEGISIAAVRCSVQGNSCKAGGISTNGAFGIQVNTGSSYLNISGNSVIDSRGTPLQGGIRFVGASDRCIVTGNIAYGNTTNITGLTVLTDSIVESNISS